MAQRPPTTTTPPRTLRSMLGDMGPYSPGVLTTKAALSPARQRDLALAQQQPDSLRMLLESAMAASPTRSGQVEPALAAYNLATRNIGEGERRALEAAQSSLSTSRGAGAAGKTSRYDPQTEAGMTQVTSASHGVRGATTGTVNGKRVLIPAAGMANRLAFQTGMSDINQDPNNVGDPDAATMTAYRRAAAEQQHAKALAARALAAKIAEEDAKNRGLIGLEKVKGDNAARVAGITSGGKKGDAKAKDTEGVRKQLGALREQLGQRYESAVAAVKHDVSIGMEKRTNTAVDPRSPEFRMEVQRRLRDLNLQDRNEYVARKAREQLVGAMGATPGYEYRQDAANDVFPGLFERGGMTPPPNAAPAARTPNAPMRPAAAAPPQGGPVAGPPPATPPPPRPGPPPVAPAGPGGLPVSQQPINAVANPGAAGQGSLPVSAPPTPPPVADDAGNDIAPPSQQEIALATPAELERMIQGLRAAAPLHAPEVRAAYLQAAQMAEQRLAGMGG